MRKNVLRIFYRYAITYISIIAVLLCCMIPIYRIILNSLKEKEIVNVSSHLSTGVTNFDRYIQDLSQAANTMSQNMDYRIISLKQEPLQANDYYSAFGFQSFFLSTIKPTPLVSSAYITFANNDVILDLTKMYKNRDELYAASDINGKTNYEQGLSSVLEASYQHQRQKNIYIHNNETKSYMTTFFPLSSYAQKDDTLAILIDMDYLIRMFLPEQVLKEGFIYFTDSTGNIVMAYNYNETAPMVSMQPEVVLDHVKTDIITGSLKSLGLQVVAGIPQTIYAPTIQQSIRGILLYATFAVFLGILLSFVFSYRYTINVRSLMNALHEIGIKNEDDSGNENVYDYTLNALSALNMDKEKFSREALELKNIIRYDRIDALFKRYVPYDSKDLKNYGIEFAPVNRLILMKVGTEHSLHGNHQLETSLVHALTILKTTLPDEIIVHVTDSKYICIVAPCDRPPFIEEASMVNKMSDLINAIESSTNVTISLVIGEAFDNYRFIFESFSKIKNVMDSTYAKEKIIIYEQKAIDCYKDFIKPMFLTQLYELLLMGKENRSISLLDDMFPSEIMHHADFIQIFYSVRGVMSSAIIKLSLTEQISVMEYNDEKTYEAHRQALITCVKQIAAAINVNKKSHNDHLKEKLLRYISEEYQNPQLSISSVADHFNISSKYCSLFLKEQTGKTYSEYLEILRLEQSVGLLKNSKRNINEIAESVGFASQNTFYKAFKRVYGVSPSDWRKTQGSASYLESI